MERSEEEIERIRQYLIEQNAVLQVITDPNDFFPEHELRKKGAFIIKILKGDEIGYGLSDLVIYYGQIREFGDELRLVRVGGTDSFLAELNEEKTDLSDLVRSPDIGGIPIPESDSTLKDRRVYLANDDYLAKRVVFAKPMLFKLMGA